jgi:hypothetical protein
MPVSASGLQAQVMVSGQAAQRHPAGPAVDVQDVGELRR